MRKLITLLSLPLIMWGCGGNTGPDTPDPVTPNPGQVNPDIGQTANGIEAKLEIESLFLLDEVKINGETPVFKGMDGMQGAGARYELDVNEAGEYCATISREDDPTTSTAIEKILSTPDCMTVSTDGVHRFTFNNENPHWALDLTGHWLFEDGTGNTLTTEVRGNKIITTGFTAVPEVINQGFHFEGSGTSARGVTATKLGDVDPTGCIVTLVADNDVLGIEPTEFTLTRSICR